MKFILIDRKRRDNAIAAIRTAPEGWEVEIREPRRTLPQNDAFWPRVREIARAVPFGDRMRSEEDWRTLLLSGWMKATGRRVEIVEGLEGEPVALGIHSSSLRKSEMNEALEYISAFAAEHAPTEAV